MKLKYHQSIQLNYYPYEKKNIITSLIHKLIPKIRKENPHRKFHVSRCTQRAEMPMD